LYPILSPFVCGNQYLFRVLDQSEPWRCTGRACFGGSASWRPSSLRLSTSGISWSNDDAAVRRAPDSRARPQEIGRAAMAATPLLSFCAMLSVEPRTKKWKEPGNFKSCLIWVVQLLIFAGSSWSGSKDSAGCDAPSPQAPHPASEPLTSIDNLCLFHRIEDRGHKWLGRLA
jgi:hypothetical protein